MKKKNEQEILNLRYKEFFLSNDSPNNFVLLKNDQVVQIKTIFHDGDLIKVKGLLWKVKDSIHKEPIKSKHLNMYELCIKPSSPSITISIERVKSKVMKIAVNFSKNSSLHHFALFLLH